MTELEGISVQAKQQGLTRLSGAENGLKLDQSELFKAACCNLGESFVNNASTDVNYSDAATGAKQVKLMGLSGTYVQLLSENLPAFRGVASPFALDYVPGTFMKSLMVSKGASSVKNGYESVTGQINVDYLKPDDEEQVNFNLYGDS
ncbi:MAG: TonB-dependent receptor, partial [Bacteroidales bacterium]|nr:TonB-dependent receptor [Bacteroidales bacterium]